MRPFFLALRFNRNFLTNQIHKWVHQDAPVRWISFLQRKNWILSPEYHRIHHTSLYNTYFCITAGRRNHALHKVGFYRKVKKSSICSQCSNDKNYLLRKILKFLKVIFFRSCNL
ncbi:fatty acid desaturase CarF family protein [Leptospira broomii]